MTRLPDERILIKYPISLNKWIDEHATPERMGDMNKLYNYIPERGQIVTRKGIEALTHTAQTT